MIYYAKLKDSEKRVEIERSGDTYSGTIDGQPFVADARFIDGPTAMSLIVNRKCYEVIISNTGKTMLVSTGGEEFEIELSDELEHRAIEATSHHPDLEVEEVRAPMPGVVVSVEVEAGQEVQAGSSVVIVEAMKMQNEIATVAGGRIKKVVVKAGEVVESKQTLVIIDRT
jgi:biotin carboxyl carrier protein